MRYLIFDLEATCWDGGFAPDQMETIEIGAVSLASSQGPIESEFATFVRPFAHPNLSDFCTNLTSITQAEVDAALFFPDAFANFVNWATTTAWPTSAATPSGCEPFTLVSWGAYDPRQLQTDCKRCNLEYPASFGQHINLKQSFGKRYSLRPPGMTGALKLLELPLVGTHHRGIDDARNIAQIALRVLPQLEADTR